MSDEQMELCFEAGLPQEGTAKRAVLDAMDKEWRSSWSIQSRMHGRYASESTVTARLRELRAAGLAESRALPGQRHVDWRRA